MVRTSRSLSGKRAAREARAVVREELRGRPAEMVETAVLLAGELVTNAIVHGGSELRLDLDLDGKMLRVAVSDDDPARPTLQPPSADRENGRGMLIVDSLATAWGVDGVGPTQDSGKRVWFELDVGEKA
jgi:anti-sigma regulatory factor (Ser/Thr protein kinase)